ncbi:MAG: LemA family protein [Candidatus Eisenbacteria bacterium]|nr:LemA family protein [Candidatus Eisenbacteria bacterium]
MGLVVFLVVVVVLAFLIIGIYNRLVKSRNIFRNAFAQIDVQLRRRHDLIPNLVETAKAYLAHERETLEAVIRARAAAVSATDKAAGSPGGADAMQGLAQAEGMLSGALGRLLVVMERYPELKADQSTIRVMEELTSTENRIAFSRQAFNDAVMAFNILRETFPNNLVAGAFRFDEARLLDSIDAPEQREAPKVDFSRK